MSKQSKHEDRKSYKKWGQTGQLVGRVINFLPKSSHPRGEVVGLILPQDYHPEKKLPSRRDKHRAEVAARLG